MTITPTTSGTALTAAQLAASNGTSSASSSASTDSGNTALASLSSNYSDFLTLLTTQLQNQDPSSPMDSSQFTSELVQFSGVEQQINTNSALSQLISLTSAGNIASASSMLGATVSAGGSELPLQNGNATLDFNAPAAEPVNIVVSNTSGETLYDATVNASAGNNKWSWDGTDSSGTTLPDGAYDVSVTSTDSTGTASAVPFTINGTATSLDSGNNTLSLNLGAVSVPFSAITAVNRNAVTSN